MFNFASLIAPVTNLVGSHLKNKQEEKQAKHKSKMKVIQTTADWESKMADSSSNSWNDEFWTVVLSVPIFMIGYAIAADDTSVIDRVTLAFQALNGLPEWYQYLLFIAISSSFGIRGAKSLMNLRK